MNRFIPFLAIFAFTFLGPKAEAQHLWWNLEGQTDATCIYGEVTVLATHPAIYYCGANWHPGEPAGGYCGIQHNTLREKRTIFSIWDTSPTLHPTTTEADPKTIFNRFGGEGEGGHTHLVLSWKLGEPFPFFVQKQKGETVGTTDTRFYIHEGKGNDWLHVATIQNPNGGHKSVETLGGGLNSFLENFSDRDKDTPKVALYRLWLGTSIETLKPLTRASGDGVWGQMDDAYFLAEGSPAKLDEVFARLEKTHGKPLYAKAGKELPPVTPRAVPDAAGKSLRKLPRATGVSESAKSR